LDVSCITKKKKSQKEKNRKMKEKCGTLERPLYSSVRKNEEGKGGFPRWKRE